MRHASQNKQLWQADEKLHRQLYQQSFKYGKGFNPDASQNQTQAMIASGSRWGKLSSITMPALVIHGTYVSKHQWCSLSVLSLVFRQR